MRIDAHQHFWAYDAGRDTWITDDMSGLRRDFLPGDLEPVLAANGIAGCIAVESAPSLEQTQFLLALARDHSFIGGVVGWVDLFAADIETRLSVLAADPRFVGVRVGAQNEADDFLTRADVIRGIAAVGAAGLPFDILIRERQLPSAIGLTRVLPDQTFVLDHIAKPRIRERVLEPWATHVRELAQNPRVFCKVSGMVTEADWQGWRPEDLTPYLDVVFSAFGTERTMFASDWPVCLVAAGYGRVIGVLEQYLARFGGAERVAVFGGNAARCYLRGR
ncbi:MAG TPA: amidohydrolase family protein [Gemmatimonadaceae bacterium]|nr:amidohydrolase family protein [Gemmatimonadaceae bacterium]